jgi:signal peptidase I
MSFVVWGLLCLVVATVGLLGVLVLSGRLFAVVITGCSMEPALRHGQRVFVLRCRPDRARCGDIVLLVDPANPNAFVIKRIAALPGDPAPIPAGAIAAGAPVPDGQVLLLGDNPTHSVDSRLLGGYDRRHILGVALTGQPFSTRLASG